jgi:DNA helicase-2/ATP-dependent DNA helicase PcrA
MMYEQRTRDNGETPTLKGFLEEVALISDVDNLDEEKDACTLMTVHSAKGLEFNTVILPGFEEGVFPGTQTMSGTNADMEEERRLAYVAVTRAKKKLIICHANTRLLYGKTSSNQLSRFALEIPKELVVIEQPMKTVYNHNAS